MHLFRGKNRLSECSSVFVELALEVLAIKSLMKGFVCILESRAVYSTPSGWLIDLFGHLWRDHKLK